MTIKKMFNYINITTGISIGILALCMFLILSNQKELIESSDIRYKSYQLAIEFKETSENLTRLARTFVNTGEDKYEREYWELVAIANGEKPRADGRKASFEGLMKELNFAPEEFQKIKEANDKSNELVKLEETAINAAKGLFRDPNGSFTLKGEKDFEMARTLLHDENYHLQRDIILEPVNDFFILLDARTARQVEAYTSRSYTYLWIVLCMLGLMAGGQFISFFGVKKKVTGPIEKLNDAVDKISKGDLTARVDMTSLKRRSEDELVILSNGFNSMVKSINDGVTELEKEKQGIQRKVDEAVMESDSQRLYLEKSVEELLVKMRSFSEGDLTARVKVDKDDIIGRLFTGFNQTVEVIKGLVASVSHAVDATASSANEISSSSEEMASGAQEQTQQTTEIASAVEEMTKTILETTNNVHEAAGISRKASLEAEEGYRKIGETKQGIKKIVASAENTGKIITSLSRKSDQIGEITQVIDDIADQTNLLALNAAIEAARAGDQGRGFAVVADEVRKLAERTTKATKEIAETIKAIQGEAKEADRSMEEAGKAVNEGMQLTEGVASALQEILNETRKVNDVVSRIAEASEEQSITAEQISRNIEGISGVSQQSAAGTEQIARAAEDLSNLTVNLQELVGRFRLDGKKESDILINTNPGFRLSNRRIKY